MTNSTADFFYLHNLLDTVYEKNTAITEKSITNALLDYYIAAVNLSCGIITLTLATSTSTVPTLITPFKKSLTSSLNPLATPCPLSTTGKAYCRFPLLPTFVATLTIQERFNAHSKTDSLLGKDIRSFGKENFKIEVIEECENAYQLNERECFWINELDYKFPHGYNTMNGGSYIRECKKNNVQTPMNKKDFIFMLIGAKIAYYRTFRQMTQAELAKRANLNNGSING